MLVATIGLVLTAVVHPADVSDRGGAVRGLEDVPTRYPRLAHLWVDAGHAGKTGTRSEDGLGLSVSVVREPWRWVRRPAGQEPPPMPAGSQALPRRRVVERAFAWLGRYRRLSKDSEDLPATAEAWIHLAVSSLMPARLAKCPLSRHPLTVLC